MITVRQFQQINLIKKFNYPQMKEEMLMVGVLNNMTEDEVINTPLDTLAELKKQVSYIDFEAPKTLIPEFEHEGVKYKVDTIFKIAGQFMDYSELQKNTIDNLHLILALFAYEGENYTHDVIKRGNKFLEVDYRIAYSVAFFFSRLMKELPKSIEIYSTDMGIGTQKNGAGQRSWMGSAVATALNGTFLSKWAARNFLNT